MLLSSERMMMKQSSFLSGAMSETCPCFFGRQPLQLPDQAAALHDQVIQKLWATAAQQVRKGLSFCSEAFVEDRGGEVQFFNLKGLWRQADPQKNADWTVKADKAGSFKRQPSCSQFACGFKSRL